MVPSLVSICLELLSPYADQVVIDVPRHYNPATVTGPLHPALWATLAQVYDNIPVHLHNHHLSLAHPVLPLLQRIHHTPFFALLTVLDLPACPHLTDHSINLLSPLHSLVAFDASITPLSSYAVKVLAGTLLWVDDSTRRRGPWPLRILRLRYCDKIDDSVYPHLNKFPLLTAIDLRGTNCRPQNSSPFRPSTRHELFHPTSLVAAVDALTQTNLYTSENVFKLIINSLKDPTPIVPPQAPIQSIHTFTQKSTKQEQARTNSKIPRIRPSMILPRPIDPTTTSHSTPDSFYHQNPPSSSRPVKYDLVSNYSATTYYEWAHLDILARPAGPHDAELALYRTPPPWATLEEHSTLLRKQMHARVESNDRAVDSVAPVNRTRMNFQINQSRIDALRKSATAMRRSGVGGASAAGDSPSAMLGKNPFRRHSLSTFTAAGTSRMKILKPISAVEIPELPPNFKPGVVKNTPSTIASTSKVEPSPTAKTPPAVNKSQHVAFGSTWSGHAHAASQNKRSLSVDITTPQIVTKKIRVGDESTSMRKRKSAGGGAKQGFDWSAWSGKKS